MIPTHALQFNPWRIPDSVSLSVDVLRCLSTICNAVVSCYPQPGAKGREKIEKDLYDMQTAPSL
jgi:hypothetical protein